MWRELFSQNSENEKMDDLSYRKPINLAFLNLPKLAESLMMKGII